MSAAPFIASEVAEVTYRGQRYVRLRLEPYTRRDGAEIKLAKWRSVCPQCRQPFECITPAITAQFQPARRCSTCRKLQKWREFRGSSQDPTSPDDDRRWREFAPLDVYQDEKR